MGSDQIRIAVSEETGVSVGRYLLLLHAGDHLAGRKESKDGAEIIKEREQKAEAKQRKKRKGRSDAFD